MHNFRWPDRNRLRNRRLLLVCCCALMLASCRSAQVDELPSTQPYVQAATAIEYPDLETPIESPARGTVRPVTLSSAAPDEYWDIHLEEVLHVALEHSKIFRDAGGVILRSPGNSRTHLDPAIQETDPRFGPQAALSAFDATFAASLFYENNDRALNNVFFGGGTRELVQKSGV
ncbi:MAG: TolC family protein, partial [Planctomycetaceae bacterium]|nr:TolC family protein [Planctomycetaceae bacterium]